MKHIKYPSTDQFRTIVRTIINKARFVGLDENGDAIFDETLDLPKVKAKATIKLHGSNCGINYNDNDGLYTQSRNNKFKPDTMEGHFGFNFLVNSKKEVFINVIKKIAEENNIDVSKETITL